MDYRCILNVSSFKQDSVWSWFICFCSTLCMILSVGLNYSLGVLFPVLMESFNENRERTAWVSSISMAVFLVSGPFMGIFVNRFGYRAPTTVGCLLCAASMALGSLSPNILVLYVAFSVPFGIGISSIYVSSPVAVIQYFTKRRSLALATVTAGPGIGTMIFGPTLRALVDAFDWRNSMRIIGGVIAFASLTGCFLKGNSSSFSESKVNSKKFTLNFSALKNPRFLVLLVMSFVGTFSRMVPYVHLVKHCNDLGIPSDKSATLFLLIGLFASTGRLMAGILCDIRFVNSLYLYQAAVFANGAFTVLLIPAGTFASVAVVISLFSFADGLLVSSFVIDLFKSVEESQRASCLGFAMFTASVSVFCAPPLSGFIADHFGNYTFAFLITGGVTIIGSFIPFILLCIKRRNDEQTDGVGHLEELMDKEQGGIKEELSEGNGLSTTAVWIKQESATSKELAVRSTKKCATTRRPVSFMWAMESPFYLSPTFD